MSIEHYKERIDAWDPATGDLPDEVALALDDSDELRAHFDARFERFEPGTADAEVPADLERVLAGTLQPEAANAPDPTWKPRRRRWPFVLAGGLVAAAALVLVTTPVFFLTIRRADSPSAVNAIPSAPHRLLQVEQPPPSEVDATFRTGHADASAASVELNTLGYITEGERDPNLAAAGETYTDHGVNGFVDTRSDPRSTFAVDVDTASYTVTRRKLQEGFLPPPSAVRVEEFVNYIGYDYPQPESGPFTVQFEASPSPWSDTTYVRVGVQGKAVANAVRKPVHLVFLIDTSGSMSSADKLPLVKAAMGLLVEQLGDGDTVALVAYAGSAGVVLPPTPATEQRTILRALDSLGSGGSTAMGAGIELAYRLADQTLRDGHVNRVVIASDGDANVGNTSTGSLSELISGYAKRGITLTTLGFGNGNYRDTRMEQLANDGDGNYFYVDSEKEARRVFVEKLTGTLEVIAKDVKIQVEFNPDAVERYRLIGYENRDVADRDFRNDEVDAGEIGAGHQVTALYEVDLTDHTSGNLATVRLRAKPPGPDAPATERTFDLPAYAMQPSVAASSPDHRMALATATFAERLRASPYVMGVRYSDIADLAGGAERPDHEEDAELVSLIRKAAVLSGEQDR